MAKYVFEVLDEMNKKRHKSEKVNVLKQNDSQALRDIIFGAMSEKIIWNLPEGEPPYTPSEPHNAPANFLRERAKLLYLVKGGKGDRMQKFKRERLFIELLEGIHPNDARLVIDMVNKKTPKGITKPIVQEAFPGLLD
jgi:hypothetical protein